MKPSDVSYSSSFRLTPMGTATTLSIKSRQSLKEEVKTGDDWDDSGSDELFLQFLFVTMETLTNTLNQISSRSKLTTQLCNHPSSKLRKVEKSLEAELQRLFPSCAKKVEEQPVQEYHEDDDGAWKPRGVGDEPKITTQTSIASSSDEKIEKQDNVEMQEKRATVHDQEAKQLKSESRKSIRQETTAKQDEGETKTQQKHTKAATTTQTTPPLQPSDRKAEERPSVPTALRVNSKEDLGSLGSNFRKKLSRWQNQSMSSLPSEHLPKTTPSSLSTRHISQPSPKLMMNFAASLTEGKLPKKQPNLSVEKKSMSLDDLRQPSISTRRKSQPSQRNLRFNVSFSEEPVDENQPRKLSSLQTAVQRSKSVTKLTTAQKITLEKNQKASYKTKSKDEPSEAEKATQQPSSCNNNSELRLPRPIERRPLSKSLSRIPDFVSMQNGQQPLRRGKTQLLPSRPFEASQTNSCEIDKSKLLSLSVASDTLQQRQSKRGTRPDSSTGDQKTDKTNEPTRETKLDKKAEQIAGDHNVKETKKQTGESKMKVENDSKTRDASDENPPTPEGKVKTLQSRRDESSCEMASKERKKEAQGTERPCKLEVKSNDSLNGDEMKTVQNCDTTKRSKRKEQKGGKQNLYQRRKNTLSRFEKYLSEIEWGDVIDDTQGSKNATTTRSPTYSSFEEEDLLQFEDGEFEKIKKLVTSTNTIKQRKDTKAFWTKMKKQDDNNQLLFKTLKEQSELYAPAKIRLFGGCSPFVNNKVINCSRSSLGGDLSEEGYRSRGVRGAVTTAMLETMAHMDSDKDMTFRDALVMLRSTLSKNGYNGQEPLLASSRLMDMDEKFRIIPDEHSGYRSCGSRGGSRRALMIGVNYDEDDDKSVSSDSGSDSDSLCSGSSSDSSDSSNDEEEPNSHRDVARMVAYLKHAKGFTNNDFTILLSGGNFTKPTKKNILGAMKAFVQELKPGDVAFCYYSGRSGNRDDGRYKDYDDILLNGETLVPEDSLDQGAIMDDDLFKCFTRRVPAGVTLTCLFDCEHSGTILGLPFVFSSNDTAGTLCASEPNFFPLKEYTKLQTEKGDEDISDCEDEEVEQYKFMRSNSSDGLKAMRNSFAMRSQRKSLRNIQDLSKQAEDYLPADIRMFASCDEGEDLQHDVLDDDDDWALPFELPDASERAGGIFTTCFLKLAHERKAMSNREVLLRLGQELASTGYKLNPILTCSRPHIVNKTFHIVPENFSGERRAVLIGILYKGQKGELRGSHKDVNAVMEYLIKIEGFKKQNITLLMDDGVQEEPNRKNILNAYKNLTVTSKPGDAVFCYFAGHGGQLEDDDGDEEDGYDETILPLDVIKAGPIRDDVLFETLCVPMPKGVTMTCIFDSSHAGTVLDLPFRFSAEEDGRELIPSFCHTDAVKNYKDALEAKGKSQNFWKSVMEQARINSDDITSYNASSLCPLINEHAKVYAAADVLMIAACEDSQTAGETQGFFAIPEKVEFPGGVLTNALIESLKGRLLNGDGTPLMTNRDLLKRVCTSMERKGFLQQPIMSTSRIDAMEKSFGIIPENFSGKRHAVVIGINYKKMLNGVLHGCHEDAWNIVAYLKDEEGFRDDDITILMDDKKQTKPTRKNILQAYGKVAREAKPGDVVFTYFSGHGGQLEDQDGEEDDGFDEAIAPIDVMKNGLIRDDLLYKKLVCQMRAGVKLTAVFDCCHSGTVLDLPFAFEQNDTPFDLMKDKPNFFPHMAYARSVRESS